MELGINFITVFEFLFCKTSTKNNDIIYMNGGEKMLIVKCATCNNDLERANWQIKKFDKFYCNRECKAQKEKQKFEDLKVKFTCQMCGKSEYIVKSTLKTRKFCSQKCLFDFRERQGNTLVKCEYCGEDFWKLNSKITITNHNFCNKECSSKWFSENNNPNIIKKCLICKEDFVVNFARNETAKTCSKICHNKYISILSQTTLADQYKKNGIKACLNNKKEDTLPEQIVKQYLLDNHITFESQKPMYDKFVVDFYLVDYDIVLEVYGDYWHSNPKIYGYDENKKEPNEQQIKQIKKDKSRKGYLTKCGHKFVYIWECDIYEDVEKQIKQTINQNS